MKKFLISVNGSQYEVDVEEITGESAAAPVSPVKDPQESKPAAAAKPAPVSAPAPAAKPKPAPATANAGSKAGSETITCPMPGTILKVSVKPGQTVKKNQVLCVMEAMKMENEIVSPRDAVIAGVMITKGATVNAGDPLISLE